LRYDGVPLEDFIAIVFGLYAHVGNINPSELLHGLTHSAIESKRFLATTGFPQELLTTFLRNRSIRLTALRREINSGKRWGKKRGIARIESYDFTTDFLAFRKHPLIDLENGKHLVIDIQFVGELLFTGLFFEIFDRLPSRKRELLLSLWGRLFELYLWELLEYFYPRQANIFHKDINFPGGQVDGLLDFGTYTVVLEFKFFLLANSIKYSRDRTRLTRELRLKLVENQRGKAKAVRQLCQAVQAVRTRKIKTALKDKPVYPVVVVYEPSIESFGVNSFLNAVFHCRERFHVGVILPGNCADTLKHCV